VGPSTGRPRRDGTPAGLLRLPATLLHLRAAYRAGGVRALSEAHRAAAASPAYRLSVRGLDALFPLSRVLQIAADFDDLVRDLGLRRAAGRVLDQLGIARRTRAHPDVRSNAPALLCCNHPSVLAPLLLASAVDRDDLAIVAMDYLAALGPHVGRHVLPIARAYRIDPWTELRAGPSGLLADLAIEFFVPRQERSAARRHNRATLGRAAEHVRRGGAVAIFPQGGAGGRWLPGVGALGAALRDGGAGGATQVVPVRIDGDTPASARRHLASRGLRDRAAPVDLLFGRPLPLGQVLAGAGAEAPAIATTLERLWGRPIADSTPDRRPA
jgi:1-acyl-sn-glycerol-3-phosphate acyltransferase